MKQTILVIGANGTVGSELVRQLQKSGHKVIRATSQSELESDQVHLNLTNKNGLEKALIGIDKAFLLSPPGHVNQHEMLIPVIEQAKKEWVKKLVLMTAMGANAIETAPMRQVEIHLEKSGLAYNIIRPNWFMQNFNSYWIHGINEKGQILLPVGDAKGSFIDARDIASVAAALLQTDKFDNQDFDLTGSEAIDHNQVAAILTKETGKKIVYHEVTPAQMGDLLGSAGLPKPYADFLLMILDFFKQGYSSRTTDSVERITGAKPIRFETYARDYKNSWK